MITETYFNVKKRKTRGRLLFLALVTEENQLAKSYHLVASRSWSLPVQHRPRQESQ